MTMHKGSAKPPKITGGLKGTKSTKYSGAMVKGSKKGK